MYCFHSCLWNKLDCNYLDNCLSLHWNYMISVEVGELTVAELIIFSWHSMLWKGAFQHEIITGLSIFNKSRKKHTRLRRIETVKQTLKKKRNQPVCFTLTSLFHFSAGQGSGVPWWQSTRTQQEPRTEVALWLYWCQKWVKAASLDAGHCTPSPCLEDQVLDQTDPSWHWSKGMGRFECWRNVIPKYLIGS